MSGPRPWFVYLLECENGRLYTGISTDPGRRFAEHLAGKGAMFTRLNRPQQLLATRVCDSRSEALRLEYRIKQLKTAEKRELVAAWLTEPVPPAAAPARDSLSPPLTPAP